MAVKVYLNLIECLSTDDVPVVPDGWYLKFIDTGATFYRFDNSWHPEGLGLSYAPPTKSGVVVTDANGLASIAFVSPFIDDDYTIALGSQVKGSLEPIVNWVTKDRFGFVLKSTNPVGGIALGAVTVSWLCTRNFNS